MAQQEQEFNDFEIDVNLTDVEAWGGEGFPLAPAGDFALTLTNLEQKPSSKNQPMIVATFVIADEGEHNGKKVWNNYSLQEQSRGRLKALSVACGARLDKFIASEHVGQTIRATIVHVDGQASIDAQGNPRPPRTFANVINEMPLEEVAQQEVAPPAKPPVLKGKPPVVQQKPSTNGAPRRT
jgi:hypothetical protein